MVELETSEGKGEKASVCGVQSMGRRALQGEAGRRFTSHTGLCCPATECGFPAHLMWSMNEMVAGVEAESSQRTL